jgi:hypothetical protein
MESIETATPPTIAKILTTNFIANFVLIIGAGSVTIAAFINHYDTNSANPMSIQDVFTFFIILSNDCNDNFMEVLVYKKHI